MGKHGEWAGTQVHPSWTCCVVVVRGYLWLSALSQNKSTFMEGRQLTGQPGPDYYSGGGGKQSKSRPLIDRSRGGRKEGSSTANLMKKGGEVEGETKR